MDELVRWLGEQLDADAARAQAAPPGPWVLADNGSIVAADGSRVVSSVGGALEGQVSRWPEGPTVDHVLGQDPARVLAEIDAKRRILAIHRRYVPESGQACLGCSGGIEWEACPVVRLLALPYASRPGFRESWRP